VAIAPPWIRPSFAMKAKVSVGCTKRLDLPYVPVLDDFSLHIFKRYRFWVGSTRGHQFQLT